MKKKKIGINKKLQSNGVVLLKPDDVLNTLKRIKFHVTTTMLDPWYNKGVGGTKDDYYEWLFSVVEASAIISDHVYIWGFPEIVHKVLDNIPKGFELNAWLTWYYKNLPSVVRGWRSAQYTCLHLARNGARIYPEHFLNEKQLELKKQGKLRYMPGPPSVIEVALNIGFIGKNEQTGHPAQKPIKVIEPMILMTTKEGDLVLDPMCGAGTTGVVCKKLGCQAILCDISEEYSSMTEKRLNIKRTDPKNLSFKPA